MVAIFYQTTIITAKSVFTFPWVLKPAGSYKCILFYKTLPQYIDLMPRLPAYIPVREDEFHEILIKGSQTPDLT